MRFMAVSRVAYTRVILAGALLVYYIYLFKEQGLEEHKDL